MEALLALRKSIAFFSGCIRNVLEGIAEEDQAETVVWESKFALRRLEFIGSLCLHFCEWGERPESVFWIEKNKLISRIGRNSDRNEIWYPRFVQTPLSIAPMMKEGVFEPFRTVVCTSATLRIASRFNYWMHRTGVALMEEERVLSGVYESPFPYRTNVLFAIPEDAPLPKTRDSKNISKPRSYRFYRRRPGMRLCFLRRMSRFVRLRSRAQGFSSAWYQHTQARR